MKIVYINPGVGDTFYCQNCILSMDKIVELKRQNHEPIMVPMYLPINIEMPELLDVPIFFGAVNVYLTEKFSFFKKLPKFFQKLLDARFFLKLISKISSNTEPNGLEEMTISMMNGDTGKHFEELNRLVKWLKEDIKPDIVHLSNALLIGIAVTIKRELKIPVFCTLQDENMWIDKMKEPYRSIAWETIKKGAEHIDAFISVSKYYSELIINRTNISSQKIHVVPLGIDVKRYIKETPSFNPLTIGFLSRMSDLLGLDILIDAFILIKKEDAFKNTKLKLSGGMTINDKKTFKKIKKKLINNNCLNDVEIILDYNPKAPSKFFSSLTLLSVPVPEGEGFGLFLLESLASGIPVIQPNLGSYPEIINNAKGGIIYEKNTPNELAKIIIEIFQNKDSILSMSQNGYKAVIDNYSIEKMVSSLLKIYEQYNI